MDRANAEQVSIELGGLMEEAAGCQRGKEDATRCEICEEIVTCNSRKNQRVTQLVNSSDEEEHAMEVGMVPEDKFGVSEIKIKWERGTAVQKRNWNRTARQ